MNKKSIAGIGIGIAVAIAMLVILSSTNLAPSTIKPTLPNVTNNGPTQPAITPTTSTPTTTTKKSYTLELNESVGIAAK